MSNVLITGGSRGIGAELVKRFAKQGYKVCFTYKKSREAAEALARETGAVAICADSSVEEDVVRAVREAEKLEPIDCLINNAAISSFSMFTDLTLAQWNDIVAVNLTGAFLYSREVARSMIRRKRGSIVNISSVWGLVGASCEVHYSTVKAGLVGMTKALAKELGPSSIRVNAIAPGVIGTEMNAQLSEEDMRSLVDETPLMRIGTTSDVAAAALFLASDEASFITGEILNVSGGFVI